MRLKKNLWKLQAAVKPVTLKIQAKNQQIKINPNQAKHPAIKLIVKRAVVYQKNQLDHQASHLRILMALLIINQHSLNKQLEISKEGHNNQKEKVRPNLFQDRDKGISHKNLKNNRCLLTTMLILTKWEMNKEPVEWSQIPNKCKCLLFLHLSQWGKDSQRCKEM